MKEIEALAPAKLNLFLKILNKRPDGYHNIETVFEKISLFDRIVIKENPRNEIIIESNSRRLPLDKNNIIYKSIVLIKEKFKINKGLFVYLDKNIPISAGLGGGSSDAAAVLKGLNKFWKLGLSKDDFLDFAGFLGCDVPLFILEDSFLLGRERGDKLFKIPKVGNFKLWHILAAPDKAVSTIHAYTLFDKCSIGISKNRGKMGLTMPDYSVNIITYALLNRDVSLLNYYSYNSFESLIIRQFPALIRIKSILERLTSSFVHMSGSGSTLFITFSDRKEAENVMEKIKINKAMNKCRFFLVSTY